MPSKRLATLGAAGMISVVRRTYRSTLNHLKSMPTQPQQHQIAASPILRMSTTRSNMLHNHPKHKHKHHHLLHLHPSDTESIIIPSRQWARW